MKRITPKENFRDLTGEEIIKKYALTDDRVQLHKIHPFALLAIGFGEDSNATGRVAWIFNQSGRKWEASLHFGLGASYHLPGEDFDPFDDEEDLENLFRWLKGE